MSIHIGMHWGIVIGRFQRRTGSNSRRRTILLRAAAVLTAGYGTYALFYREIGTCFEKENITMAEHLILYCSRTGGNYRNGSIRNIAKGNTEVVAEFIQNAVGGDPFEVETVKSYAKA